VGSLLSSDIASACILLEHRLSNCFNLIDHNCIPLLLECQSQGVKITNVGIFASGALVLQERVWPC
jgi:hypothetical protein